MRHCRWTEPHQSAGTSPLFSRCRLTTHGSELMGAAQKLKSTEAWVQVSGRRSWLHSAHQQSTNQSINLSTNQSTNWSIYLSINQPTNQPTNQPIDQSIYQAINELKPITVLRDVWRMLAFPLISSIPMTKVFILPAKLSLSWQTDGQTDKHQTSPAAAHHHTHTTVLSTWSDFTNCCQIFTNSFTCHWCANLS